jgi:hypothetical protein
MCWRSGHASRTIFPIQRFGIERTVELIGTVVDMIWDSYPWKNQLVADAEIIERWASKTQVTQRRSTLIERKVFLAAYAIRKLYENYKLWTAFHERSLPSLTYPAKSRSITPLNAHNIEQLYDFDRPKTEAVSARHLMDIIVHSLVFSEVLGDDLTVEGFLVTSDRKSNCVWGIKIGPFVKLMRDVGNDYPPTSRIAGNPETGEFVVWQGQDSPPKSFEDPAHRIVNEYLQAKRKDNTPLNT